MRNFFTPDELQPCREAVGELVEELAQKLFKAGKIKGLLKMITGIYLKLIFNFEYLVNFVLMYKTWNTRSLFSVIMAELYHEYGIFQRLTKLEEVYPGSNILLFKQGKLPKVNITG